MAYESSNSNHKYLPIYTTHSSNKSKTSMNNIHICIQRIKEKKNVDHLFIDQCNLPQQLPPFILPPETINTQPVLMEINGRGQQRDVEEQKKNHHECWRRRCVEVVEHLVSG